MFSVKSPVHLPSSPFSMLALSDIFRHLQFSQNFTCCLQKTVESWWIRWMTATAGLPAPASNFSTIPIAAFWAGFLFLQWQKLLHSYRVPSLWFPFNFTLPSLVCNLKHPQILIMVSQSRNLLVLMVCTVHLPVISLQTHMLQLARLIRGPFFRILPRTTMVLKLDRSWETISGSHP